MLVIPAIDLKQGACVRLRQGLMEQTTVFSSDPVAMAERWVAAGCRRLHLVDLDGAFAGKPVNGEVIGAIAAAFPELAIQVGGGVRNRASIERYLAAGVSFVILGTRAVREPDFVARACAAFPGQVMVGLDARNGRVATDGWARETDVLAVDLARRFDGAGVAAIVYTDIARDGMLRGVNLPATLAMGRASPVPVIASGGISSLDDIRSLAEHSAAGICGAITGRAIYEGTLDLGEAQTLADRVAGGAP